MKRRDFIMKGIGAGILAGSGIGMSGFSKLMGNPAIPEDGIYDLVAVRGNNPADMFDEGMKSIGGLSEFVKPGQTVVVKPNIGWDATPERAANTNPELIARIVKRCYEAGAKSVSVFDNTCDEWKKCYANSGIEEAVKTAGGSLVPGNSESYYKQVTVGNGKKLKEAKVHELILNSDVFINVPVLKSHSSAKLTIAMKNLMGVVWDRRFWHQNDLHQCIADYTAFRKPDLNIIDAYRVMKRNGPRGVSTEDVIMLDSLLISRDIVAADAAAAKLFGFEPEEIPYIAIADEMGLGTMDLSKLSIQRIKM
ncbi:MAG TPA: DUF362 domain-containing protein [Bacteroidales bacterium]|nr:DUF362 domain-containing protein [Bacteroidales bacterium]